MAVRLGSISRRLNARSAQRLRPTARTVAIVVALAVLLVGAGSVAAWAEVVTSTTVSVYNSFSLLDGDVYATGLGQGELDFQSSGNRMVRSRLALKATLLQLASLEGIGGGAATYGIWPSAVQVASITVPRAEVRWRIPLTENFNFRATTGRTRLSWGDGVVFNAGDVINGVAPAGSLNLTADTLRDETQWLVKSYLPLGRFGFVEPVVVLPPMVQPETADGEADGSGITQASGTFGTPSSVEHSAVGGRIQYKLGQIKTEAGYLFEGANQLHRPYVSLQGNLLVDWYVAGSLQLPDDPTEHAYLSGGLFHTAQSQRGGGWSVRLEGLWQAPQRFDLFGETTWSPSQLFNLFARSQWEVETANVNSAAGVQWLPATGLTLGVYGTLVSGAAATAQIASVVGDATAEADFASGITAAVVYSF